jgi:hypothetical protein
MLVSNFILTIHCVLYVDNNVVHSTTMLCTGDSFEHLLIDNNVVH